MKTKVAVLGGGVSPEREVSLRSAKNVYEAARQAGFDCEFLDPADGMGKLAALPKNTIILPILHGAGGEDGTIQTDLENLRLKYLGADSQSSRLCFDKWEVRQILLKHNIVMAQGERVDKMTYPKSALATRPHVLKVCHGGSSIGTYIVKNPDFIDQAKIQEVFSLDDKAVVEELIEGIEITVPILDKTALPVIEIQPPTEGGFDYDNKYNGKTKELCPPVSIDQDIQNKAQKIAEQVHSVTGCRHLSRTDMIVRPSGEIIVLEINTMPGMTDQSLYPKSAATAGIDFAELIKQFVNLAAS